jgi:signal transduction histidine kinase
VKARARLAATLAICLILSGAVALVADWIALGRADYPTWPEYRDALIEEMDVSRESVIREIGENPEVLFDGPAEDELAGARELIDAASQRIQREAVEEAAADSRRWTAVALAAITVGGFVAAWALAGRFLRPIRLITAKAKSASGEDLSARVALSGPDDEIKELADTFDAMLDRIERAFDGQRRFAAQLSHELRTPLAIATSEVGMLLDEVHDPAEQLRLQQIADAVHRADRLVAQLLVLARTQAGDLEEAPFPFDELVGNVVGRAVEAPEWRAVRIDLDLEPVEVIGDRTLLESLVRNLVHNAVRHNRSGGWVRVRMRMIHDGAVLEIANSVPAGRGPGDGAPGEPHVGLTIVAAVIEAHDGSIEWARSDDAVCAVVRLATSTNRLALAGHADS